MDVRLKEKCLKVKVRNGFLFRKEIPTIIYLLKIKKIIEMMYYLTTNINAINV